MSDIINRVAQSGIQTIDPAEFYPQEDICVLDLKDYLWQGMVLKEKDFRDSLKEKDWSEYAGTLVTIICSEDTIIPTWAYMLLATSLEPYAVEVFVGSKEALIERRMLAVVDSMNMEDYQDKRVVIKGCGDVEVPASIYAALSRRLKPMVKSLMFGEPCSTVPVFKQARK